MRAMRLARCSRLVLVVCAIVVGVQLAPLPLHADTAAGTQQQPTLAQDMHQLFGGGNGLVRGNTSSLVSSSGSSPAFGAPLGAADASDEGVPMHLQSTLLNDTCTLSSQPNGSMVMTCPGCTLYVPMHYANFDVELFFSKAVNYAYVCAAVTLLQIIVTFKQMKTSESPAASGRLCRFTVGMQGLLDGYQSLFHMFIAFNCEALFNAFIVTSLAQFVACFMFGSAFLHHLYKIAFPADFEGGWERAQRTRKLINLKFYTVLMTGLVIFWEVPGGFELVHFVLYGFWVPQIIWQAVHGVKRGFTTSYIVAMSATRLMLPLYFLACPVNFLHHHTEPWKVALLLAWMAAQLAVLTMQRKWGARFFVPARFLPQPYDYFRSIPLLSLTRRSRRHSRLPSADLSGLAAALAPDAADADAHTAKEESVVVTVEQPEAPTSSLIPPMPAPPTRSSVNLSADLSPLFASPASASPVLTSSRSTATGVPPVSAAIAAAVESAPEDDNPCPICYTELDPDVPRSIMVCPCDHIYHAECLRTWMQQKNECPVCRAQLPIEERNATDSERDDDDDDEVEYAHGAADIEQRGSGPVAFPPRIG